MELRVLRYFLAVAREENITAVAETLYVTQPRLEAPIAIVWKKYQVFSKATRLFIDKFQEEISSCN